MIHHVTFGYLISWWALVSTCQSYYFSSKCAYVLFSFKKIPGLISRTSTGSRTITCQTYTPTVIPLTEKRINIQGGPKIGTISLYALTLPNINQFSKSFPSQNQGEKICNNTITKDPSTPQVCRYTTLWNVKYLKSNNWKHKTTSVTTHFKKLTTGNSVFIVSVIV